MLPRRSDSPVLRLAGFDGPMDLLLDQAERQRIDFAGTSILALVDQFMTTMEALADKVAIEHRANWLVLATRLVLLYSRLLLPEAPADLKEVREQAAAELRRAGEMAFVRAASSWLQARPQLGLEVFARPPAASASRTGGYVALMEACLAMLQGKNERLQEALSYQLVSPPLWRVSDALARIRTTLIAHPQGGDLARFLPGTGVKTTGQAANARAAVSSTLLAGLELAREGVLVIEQNAEFGPIRLAAHQDFEGFPMDDSSSLPAVAERMP